MGRRETHGKYNKNKKQATYVRTLSVQELLGNVKKSEAPLLTLTVRGLVRGVVQMADADGTLYTCSKEQAKGALFGDTVAAECVGRERVVVRRVITRAHEYIVGVLGVGKFDWYLTPMERHLPQSVVVEGPLSGAQEGDIVRTKVVRWTPEMAVRIEERLGCFEKAAHALSALVSSMHLKTEFSPDALEQAQACRDAVLEDDPRREDLRALLSFTIDGADAKDFDDAVSIEALPGGHVRLGVHIADVGHYVPLGTALDREAYRRGTSVYLPGRVLPMLPERLSNGVCSLRPGEDKFTLSALMELDAAGEVETMRLARTITCSKARLVYDDVNRLFEGDEAQREAYRETPGLCEALEAMRKLAESIRKKRQDAGAIDFETSEPRFVLDAEGEPVEIIKRERGEAEMMIEDFMLTANSCVARYAKAHGVPLLYRVHENPDPEKLATFASFLSVIGVTGYRVPGHAKPAQIRAVLEGTRERPEFGVISTLALRSMQKARYDAQPLGHYGLAMEDYCHFTSPIRRYPDLVVSRALSAVIKGERVPMTGDKLDEAALHSSDRERAAVEAERAADKMMMARFMASHVGEVFNGAISGVTEFGVFVELENGAEGFMHVRTLNDWFNYDERRMQLRGERSGAVFALGQAISVRVQDVQLAQSAVDLELAGPLGGFKREKSAAKRERERMRSFYF